MKAFLSTAPVLLVLTLVSTAAMLITINLILPDLLFHPMG